MMKKDVFDDADYPKINLGASNYFSNLFSVTLGNFGGNNETKYGKNTV